MVQQRVAKWRDRQDRDLQALTCVALGLVVLALGTASAIAVDRPNILLIMADDLGYSDLGCYGGEIETPNIDGLAAEGLRFSEFRATPMCVTSRITLMAGMPYHRAGTHQYSHAAPLPILLKQSGYRTIMTGKWHAGSPDPRSRKLFDRSFGFLGGMTDSFRGGNDWFHDGEAFGEFPDGFYSTRAFADKSIEFMQEAVSREQPFFAYVAFNAPHHPCQAPEATVGKYLERYRAGYAAVRAERHRRLIELGLVDSAWDLAPHEEEVRRWEELSEHRRDVEAARMAAYAAAVDEVDKAVGRLLDFLREAEVDRNTLVLFLSDNGGDYNNGAIDRDERQIPWQPGSNPTSSNGWAWVKNAPFRYYKHSCHEGGLAVPLVIRWPAGVGHSGGTILRSPTHITDLYPTFLQLAATEYPTEFEEHETAPLTGSSLLPLLRRGGDRQSKPVFSWYRFSRAWNEGDWKVVSLYDGPWQLYNLNSDRGESRNLAQRFPQRVMQLSDKWTQFARLSEVPLHPIVEEQKGWGWHRLQMVCPQLESLEPENSSMCSSPEISLRLTFKQPVDFSNTDGKTIRLFEVSNESQTIWQADPDTTHPAQGERELEFDHIPRLTPGRQYFVLWDPGWVKVGGRPVGPLNDGAYWWRFRAPADSSE
jgi:arylsulfatase A-like enzyme